jgi:hypothetical protein
MCVGGHEHVASPQHSQRFAEVARGGLACEMLFFELFEGLFFIIAPPSSTLLGWPRPPAEAMDGL